MLNKNTPISFWQLWNMNFGFLGIQYSFGLQQTAVNPIYMLLGANPDELPLLNLAGPMTGLLVQPLIGALSDRTWHPRLGRRKPYFLIGAILCSLALFAFPFSSSIWMAAGLLWILDAGNNTAMEPYRAFVADVLPEEEQRRGFLIQSFFTGFGITLANLCLYFLQKNKFLSQTTSNGLPFWVYVAFIVGGIASITTILWAMHKTKENPPTAEELALLRKEKKTLFSPLIDVLLAIKDMPKVLWKLAILYLFQWYALFVYWQFSSLSVAQTIFDIPVGSAMNQHADFSKAVSFTGLLNATYNIVTFIVALLLMRVLTRFSAYKVHAFALGIAAIGLFQFSQTQHQGLQLINMIGLGIAWASIMGVPYLMVVKELPREKYGVYMGIINMMIVIPMLIETLTFGAIYNNLLGGVPARAIAFAAFLFAIAAVLSIWLFRPRRQTTA
ncbi:MAG: MFS transporter [Flavobacteriia bacterium]|nr:MAG: MFS transporter [Flavobacteriia bacterium]